jgi:hypothetical protein
MYPWGALICKVALTIEELRAFPLTVDMACHNSPPYEIVPIFDLVIGI